MKDYQINIFSENTDSMTDEFIFYDSSFRIKKKRNLKMNFFDFCFCNDINKRCTTIKKYDTIE